MIRVGIVGLGFMGMVHYLSYLKHRDVQIVAICDKNERRLMGDWRDIRGNFGPAGSQMDLTGVTAYKQLEDMLADDSLDLIDVTLPPALHAEVAIAALHAGKHVFCEKPMSLTLEECQRMNQAARLAKKMLMIGHVLPFFPEYDWALKIIESGRYGKLLGGSFKRVISDPNWLKDFWNPDCVGGPMLDLHVHDAHFIRLLFGIPSSVTSCGRTRGSLAEYWHSQFDYGTSGPIVHATSGVIRQQGRSFEHGFEIHLEDATLTFDFSVINGLGRYSCPPIIYTDLSNSESPQCFSQDPMDAFALEISAVLKCMKSATALKILDSEFAQDAILFCQKQTESLLLRQPVAIP